MQTNEIIKKLRLEKGLTQEELGKLIGVSKSTINKYENGTIKNFKNETLEALSRIFDVPISYILNLKTEEDILKYIPSLLEKYILFNYSPPYAERLTDEDRIKAYKITSERIKAKQDFYTGKYLSRMSFIDDKTIDPYTIEEKIKKVADEVIELVFYSWEYTNAGAVKRIYDELLNLMNINSSYFYIYDKDESGYIPRKDADLELYKDIENILEEAFNKIELIYKYYK
ncbi:helix-turn-helix domain-containing protein [Macrococcoides caseolyticum]|uniref:helix-turn-helix domain-containing protein n=1 Tax=Macrococcoides caseolyticum TaxID=69966 RepID=UPI000C3460B2|nr:helix-turn-helix transcriptional regulator [Macrococcus caseolyticus]PKE47680.1 hypothetical protein CW677_06675 [Macrococcus caseolyticus]PKF14640.1 hypothetical protein CW690_06675 [Macrococcus caseolyticus]